MWYTKRAIELSWHAILKSNNLHVLALKWTLYPASYTRTPFFPVNLNISVPILLAPLNYILSKCVNSTVVRYWKTEIVGAPCGKLAGKTVAVKDNVCVAGVPMMNGSRILEGYVPEFDASVVTRVLDQGLYLSPHTFTDAFTDPAVNLNAWIQAFAVL